MNMKNEKVVVTVDTTLVVEITEEELAYLMEKREEDARKANQQSYVDELTDLFARAKRDGFTFILNNYNFLSKAESWGAAWIKVS